MAKTGLADTGLHGAADNWHAVLGSVKFLDISMTIRVPQWIALNLCVGACVVNEDISLSVFGYLKAVVTRAVDAAFMTALEERLRRLAPVGRIQKIRIFIGVQQPHTTVVVGGEGGMTDKDPVVTFDCCCSLVHSKADFIPVILRNGQAHWFARDTCRGQRVNVKIRVFRSAKPFLCSQLTALAAVLEAGSIQAEPIVT